MNREPFLSVCIPAYRRTEFLKRLLDSLSIQTWTDFEIILTDDSPDDSVARLVKGHALAEKIKYFKNPVALGTPENWNEGLRRAKGEWIKIMHDDDWFAGPESLGLFARAAAEYGASFFFSAFRNVLPGGQTEIPFKAGNFANVLARTPEILLASNRIGPPSVVLFRAQSGLIFDRNMKWLVDIDFYIRYLKQYPPAVYLPAQLVNIGISESQVTSSSFGNPAVEIPERMLLGEKLGYASLNHILVYDSWWRFVRNMHIRSESEITKYGYSSQIPSFLASIIRAQKRFPPTILQVGGFSKLLMAGYFVTEKLKKGHK